jgi:tape measure domain-containing protein
MKKVLSLVPKLSLRIVSIDKNCAVVGYASGKNEGSFLQYIDNSMYSMSKIDASNILDLDGSDDDDEVLGAAKTAESLLAPIDIEDSMLKVDNPVGLDSWNPFNGIDAPEGYSYVGKISFICFGLTSKYFASTLAMGGQSDHTSTLAMGGQSDRTLKEKKDGSRQAQRKITKERNNNDRDVGMDRGMTMQVRMQCTFIAQNEDDANQRHRDMRMMMLTKQIESTERLIEFEMKMSERMGLDSFDGINNLMDKLEQLNADLEIMMREVRSINPIVGNLLENAAKSMGLTVDVMSHCSVDGGRWAEYW